MLRTPRARSRNDRPLHPHLNFGFDPNFDTFLSLSDGRMPERYIWGFGGSDYNLENHLSRAQN